MKVSFGFALLVACATATSPSFKALRGELSIGGKKCTTTADCSKSSSSKCCSSGGNLLMQGKCVSPDKCTSQGGPCACEGEAPPAQQQARSAASQVGTLRRVCARTAVRPTTGDGRERHPPFLFLLCLWGVARLPGGEGTPSLPSSFTLPSTPGAELHSSFTSSFLHRTFEAYFLLLPFMGHPPMRLSIMRSCAYPALPPLAAGPPPTIRVDRAAKLAWPRRRS
jgi:hypothetical protein